jgi:hypothetical protein
MGRGARVKNTAGWAGCLLLVACQPELDVTWEALGCTDIDFADPPDSELQLDLTNGDLVARRTAVFLPSDAVFEPGVAAKGKEIVIEEQWIGGGGEGSVETCFVPTVVLADPVGGTWTVVWNIAGESGAFGNDEIEVDAILAETPGEGAP